MTKGKSKNPEAQDSMVFLKSNNDIKFHQAKHTVDQHGQVFKIDVLNKIEPESLVRISMYVSKRSRFYGTHKLTFDSPYLRIVEIRGRKILGEVLDKFRYLAGDHYPLKTGSHVWFDRSKIIEIWCDGYFSKYKTNKYITYTGPFETIEDYESSSDDESESDASDQSIDRSKLDLRCVGQ